MAAERPWLWLLDQQPPVPGHLAAVKRHIRLHLRASQHSEVAQSEPVGDVVGSDFDASCVVVGDDDDDGFGDVCCVGDDDDYDSFAAGVRWPSRTSRCLRMVLTKTLACLFVVLSTLAFVNMIMVVFVVTCCYAALATD